MKWCAYLVTCILWVNADCQLGDNIWKVAVKNNSKEPRFLLKSLKNDNITVTTTKYMDIVADDLIESITEGEGNEFRRGKRCLRNIDKCKKEDTSYHTSASHLGKYLLDKMPPFNLVNIDGISQECQKSSQKFLEDLQKFEYWALQMYDATAKIPSGFLSGNILQFGDFDLCMMSKSEAHNIYGQYCLANMQFEAPKSSYLAAIYNLIHAHGLFTSKLGDPGHRVPRYSSIQWGICIPDSCSPQDVDIALKEVLKNIFNGTEIQYNTLLDSELCSSARPEPLPTTTIIGGIFFLSVILLEILATLYDIFCQDNKKGIIVAFSLKKNLRKLTSIKNEDDIDAIHVVRFLNGLMLLAAHKSMALLFVPYTNRTVSAEVLGQTWTVVGRAASLYTDPFIMLSGTLSAYSFFGRLNKSEKINIFHEYLSRVLRILPTFAALIMFCTFILPWTNAGPLWNSVVTHHSDICKQNWWRNIFFIHNYFGFREMCLTHTHHIGIDTQLFLLSPLLVLLIWKWPRRGLLTLFALGAISTAMRYYSTYTMKLSNYVHYGVSTEQLFLTADHMYILPAYRLTVYVMGIALGYILRQYNNISFKVVYIHIGNVVALLCFCGAFIAPSFMGQFDYIYNPRDAAWYAAYAPILWCLCFAWFIYITQIGYRSHVSSLLQSSIPKYWTKISYTVYLTQFPIYFYNVGITKNTDEYGVIRKHLNFLEVFWVVFLSIILTVLFEFPSHNIRDLIFKHDKSKVIKGMRDAKDKIS